QIVPEYFVPELRRRNVLVNLSSLITRTQLCVAGCLECVNNGDGSVHGSLLAGEHVSRNLLNLLVSHVRSAEPGAYLRIPQGADLGGALQARAGRPVLLPDGQAATADIMEDNGTRRVLLTQVLAGVTPAPEVASLLASAAGG